MLEFNWIELIEILTQKLKDLLNSREGHPRSGDYSIIVNGNYGEHNLRRVDFGYY